MISRCRSAKISNPDDDDRYLPCAEVGTSLSTIVSRVLEKVGNAGYDASLLPRKYDIVGKQISRKYLMADSQVYMLLAVRQILHLANDFRMAAIHVGEFWLQSPYAIGGVRYNINVLLNSITLCYSFRTGRF